jgi:sec-independent protein translocase protein TatA
MPAQAIAFSPAPAIAFLEGIGAMEMMLVAVIGLLLFGGKGLPDMARTLGKVVREFKKATANVEQEVQRVMNEEPSPPSAKPRPRTRPALSVPASVAPATLPPPASANELSSPPSRTDAPPPAT